MWSVCILVLLLPVACQEQTPTSPAIDQSAITRSYVDPEAVAQALVRSTGWPAVDENGNPVVLDNPGGDWLEKCQLWQIERESVVGDIVHYSFRLRVGPGPYDVVGLHRVVKERRPFRPIRTHRSLFAVHGTPGHFTVMFLPGAVVPEIPADQSFAVYLAQHDVDVWGIDQAYTLLPQDTEDFSFMANWDLRFDAQNVRTGMAVARLTRLLTGSGYDRMNLLGYSTGSMTGFAALDLETQLPAWQRQIGGYIPVDFFYKTNDEAWRQSECDWLPEVTDLVQSGVYQNDYGLLFQTLGSLGQDDPSGDSEIVDWLDNLHAALFVGAVTGVAFGMPDPDVHYLAGVFDADENVIDLQYTDVGHYLGWLRQFNSYGSNPFDLDNTLIHCDEGNSPYDDHLGEISVPVFFLGAHGSWGDLMDDTASLLSGSDDVTLLDVQLQGEKRLDIGHVNIFTAAISAQMFWQPVWEWIASHD